MKDRYRTEDKVNHDDGINNTKNRIKGNCLRKCQYRAMCTRTASTWTKHRNKIMLMQNFNSNQRIRNKYSEYFFPHSFVKWMFFYFHYPRIFAIALSHFSKYHKFFLFVCLFVLPNSSLFACSISLAYEFFLSFEMKLKWKTFEIIRTISSECFYLLIFHMALLMAARSVWTRILLSLCLPSPR